MDNTEEKALLQEISDYIETERRELEIPGLAVAVAKDGEKIWSRGFGHRDLDGDAEVTPGTLLAIGSSTKPFTTTGVAMLAEEGELDWDEPLRSYLPGFRLDDALAGERLTLRDMACHRSGLPRYDLSLFNPDLSREDYVDCLEHLKANHDFRTRWQYQNLMYTTLGYVIEQVTGSSWEEFTRERILEPLGMKPSTFSLEDSQQTPDYGLPHGRRDGEIVQLPWIEIGATGPAGSINATADGMANWLILNLQKGKWGDQELLSSESITELHTPQMVMPESRKHPERQFRSYGLAWFIESYRGRRLIHHGGNTVGFTSSVSFMPKEGLGVVVLSNMSQDWLPEAVSFFVYDKLLGLEPINWGERSRADVQAAKESMKKSLKHIREGARPDTDPSHELEEYAGTYEHPGLGSLTVRMEDGGLKARYGLMDIDLQHQHYDAFAAELDLWFDTYTVLADFGTDKHDGRINTFSMPFGFETGLEATVFTRAREAASLSEEVLEKYVGEYEVEVAGGTITVSLRDETLVVRVPGQSAMEVFPVSETKFEPEDLPGFSLEFKLEGERVSEVVIAQPGGIFTAVRRE